MAKVIKKIKLQLPAGKATPAPPVGTVLGPAGVNIGEFVTKFNEQTRAQMGDIIPVEMSVYDDRSFTFILKVSPAASLVMKAAGIEKGSGKVPTVKAGSITKAQLKEIAEKKMPDLNTTDPAAAERLIVGTARSMGVDVK
ncbi:50S ribosomal protein L11 [Candidatus Kaiserbacteria bacterium RIFCSPHIGHO2_01_FULL_48_10]|uniref:Large ribosomal subunit protein uL11 n=1 Tax=Candidatus Kaiserbacteria bacterium RIFCSPHIGHO2_01_FULL_48_10 TaxID=1798476 RepID=A0A1F6C1P4_9BACT|nr:MAG: 50S ribosomal protein L11 [Candidatus Kaiserbacteria bacterium RIFCSPHIGHO2_01_FULL_48_10]